LQAARDGAFDMQPGGAGEGNDDAEKRIMARDMSLVWNMRRFFKEVSKDSETINVSVIVMMLNLLLHLVPLNMFVYSDHR
jgi:hypothetical protein